MHSYTDTTDLTELFFRGVARAYGPSANAAVVRRIATHLPPIASSAPVVAFAIAALDHATDQAFATGWQPAELVHAARKLVGARPSRLVQVLVASHSYRTDAHAKAPAGWREQLQEMAIERPPALTSDLVPRWRASENLDDADTWCAILAVAGFLNRLSPLPILMAVPTTWHIATPPETRSAAAEPKLLARIRGLLAKAEATTFPAEAEAFSTKAQELMTRYSIDVAILAANAHASPSDGVVTRRLLIDNPYPEAKVALLGSVARVNGAQLIWHKEFGLVSAVGMPVDLDLCELLFTSLLVQSAHALREQAISAASYRRSFLIGYAQRVYERLAEVHAAAREAAATVHGRDLVPIFADRDKAVTAALEEQFPKTRPVSSTSSNWAGISAGRRAADAADLTGGRERVGERRTRIGHRS